MPTLPPWIKPANTLAAMEGGARAHEADTRLALQAQEQAQQAAQAAARIQAEQQRTQSEMVQAKMELDAKQKVQEQQSMKAAQQLQIDNARKDAELGLRQAHLGQLSEVANAKAKEAALDFADHQALSNDIHNKGIPMEKAIWAHPRALRSSGVLTEAMRASIPKLDTITKSTEIPADPGAEAQPAIPAHKRFFGLGSEVPATPATPARPATAAYKQTRTSHVPAGGSETVNPKPTQASIDALKKNPDKAAHFDEMFGDGEAEKILNPGDGAPQE